MKTKSVRQLIDGQKSAVCSMLRAAKWMAKIPCHLSLELNEQSDGRCEWNALSAGAHTQFIRISHVETQIALNAGQFIFYLELNVLPHKRVCAIDSTKSNHSDSENCVFILTVATKK